LRCTVLLTRLFFYSCLHFSQTSGGLGFLDPRPKRTQNGVVPDPWQPYPSRAAQRRAAEAGEARFACSRPRMARSELLRSGFCSYATERAGLTGPPGVSLPAAVRSYYPHPAPYFPFSPSLCRPVSGSFDAPAPVRQTERPARQKPPPSDLHADQSHGRCRLGHNGSSRSHPTTCPSWSTLSHVLANRPSDWHLVIHPQIRLTPRLSSVPPAGILRRTRERADNLHSRRVP